MKHHLESLLAHALAQLQASGALPTDLAVEAKVERARDRQHGDFASNVAMGLAKRARRKPRELAEAIVAALPASQAVHKVELAGPGFINFFLAPGAYHDTVTAILQAGARYGPSTIGNQLSIQVEFVSANPTGPLHVGHGRAIGGAAAVTDVQRTSGVGGDELDLDRQLVADRAAAVPGARLQYRGDGVVIRAGRQKEIDEAGTGDYHLVDCLRGRQRRDDGLRQFARLASRALREPHGDDACEVAVLAVTRAFHLGLDGEIGWQRAAGLQQREGMGV